MSETTSSPSTPRPRVVALVGPYGSGKSTLFEAMLSAAGSPLRRPGDARTRSMSTETRLGHASFLGDPWSILDCPGSVEFAHDAAWAAAVADIAVVVCDPDPARALTVAPMLKTLQDAGVPHLLFINKLDAFEGRIRDTIAALQGYSRAKLVQRHLPVRDGESDRPTGYIDVVSEQAYRYREHQPSERVALSPAMVAREQAARASFVEALADHDDAILEKVLEDIEPSRGELFAQLHQDVAAGALTEVLLGAAEHDHGVRRLWKALRHDAPWPEETAARHHIPAEGEALLQVFRTVHAGHAGKLSYARVWRGSVQDGGTLNGMRVGAIHRMPGGEPVKATDARTGDLVALGRLDQVQTGATLSPSGTAEPLSAPAAPPPVYALAIATQDRKDDVKLSGALHRLADEDPSLTVIQDVETGETVLRGQGEIHINATIERLASAYGIKVTTARPRVPFKETIRQPVKQHARLKRQTGGHGQFADVKIEIEPQGRGDGFRFHDRIVGGSVPRQYIPAVGEAAEEAARKGPFGYPVVDIAVTLVDGTFHAVDSSDMAFRTATRLAMTEGLAKADPVLLEPIDRVTVSVPNDYTARAQRLLTGRRGQILGYAERSDWPGWDDVEAMVPQSELHDLIIDLRSQTMGLGCYRHHFDHLAETRTRPG